MQLVVCRPAVDEREELAEGRFTVEGGLMRDTWRVRGSTSTDDGSPNPEAQVTIMNARAAELITGARSRWALAGDQLFVDFDLSCDNLPSGSLLAIGSAAFEVSAKPHTGCQKFSARFGVDALRFVNSPAGAGLRLRGLNARVVEPGIVRPGDAVRKLTPEEASYDRRP